MPHKTKRKFIDKKKAVTFQLVHRSQKDPLAADEEAPQHVLVPLGERVENDHPNETSEERELRLSKQKLYGVGFEDEYDYMQHLRQPEKQQAILVPKDSRVSFQELPSDGQDLKDEEMTRVVMDSATITLPSVVFASKEEEETGMLHRAIPPIGPQVDWDPDVVAAMDEDFDYEDPDNIIEDDFILQASGEVETLDSDLDEEEERMEDGDSDVQSWGSEEDEFAEEETRSRFTQYSMSSSVLPRNDQLSLLDDKFAKFYEMYDDEKIGDLGQVEIDGSVPVDNISQEEALKMLLGIRDEDQAEKGSPQLKTVVEEASSDEDSQESDDEDYLVELVKEEPKENWDCESIISTYSNIYNHPKIIDDLPKPIRLSKKTGIPLDTLPTRGLTKKQLMTLDLENESCEYPTRLHTHSESSQANTVVSHRRPKNETKEEKAARKQAVKECRRERRSEKKATKVAFKQEKTRQNKELINLQHNLNGVRIS